MSRENTAGIQDHPRQLPQWPKPPASIAFTNSQQEIADRKNLGSVSKGSVYLVQILGNPKKHY